MKVLILGGYGNFGKRIARLLLEKARPLSSPGAIAPKRRSLQSSCRPRLPRQRYSTWETTFSDSCSCCGPRS